MQPSDDLLPDETEQPSKELVAFLRQSIQTPVAATALEQSQILSRVQERLLQMEIVASHEEELLQQGTYGSFPREPRYFTTLPRPQSLMQRFVGTTAAVLAIGAIIIASLLLFAPHAQTTVGLAVKPLGTPVTIQARAGNVATSMQVTSGPYFLSELIAVDTSLTNHTQNTIVLFASWCAPAFNIEMSGGNAPYYTDPVHINMGCPMPVPTTLHPGQSISERHYVLLTKSGQVTLTTPGPQFYTRQTNGSEAGNITPAPDPLAGRWPSLHVAVASLIPSNRTLSLQRLNGQVTVNGPPDALPHLVYIWDVTCQNTERTNGAWSPLKTKTFSQPPCSPRNPDWTYAVGAPGYATVP